MGPYVRDTILFPLHQLLLLAFLERISLKLTNLTAQSNIHLNCTKSHMIIMEFLLILHCQRGSSCLRLES